MIGTLGRKIIFEVSDNRVLTFESMSREVSGRWTEHEVLGVKPKAEFLGPGLQTISLTIHLSAAPAVPSPLTVTVPSITSLAALMVMVPSL